MERKKIKLLSEKVKESSTAGVNINSLPEEMFLKIFSYLSQNQLCNVARVCRKWNEYTKSPALWKKVDMQFQKCGSQYNAATVFPERLPASTTHIQFLFYQCCNAVHESFYFQELCLKLNEKCLHLQTLVLNHAFLSADLPSISALCGHFLPSLQVLSLAGCMLEGCDPVAYSGTCKIELLDISACFICASDISGFTKMAYLKKLFMDECKTWFLHFVGISFLSQLEVLRLEYSEIELGIFKKIWLHALNLTELYVCNTNVRDHDLNFEGPGFPRLKVLCLNGCDFVTVDGIVSIIQLCASLQCVYVDDYEAESYACHPYVLDNRCKLEIVKPIYRTDCVHSTEVNYLCE